MNFEALLLRVLFFIVLLLVSVPAEGVTFVVFRYDDFAADKPGTRTTGTERMKLWQAEKAVDSLFAEHGVPYVISIISKGRVPYGKYEPNDETCSFDEDHEKVDFIKCAVEAGRVEVAQHGFTHINHAKDNHKLGEFRERDYKSQLKDIRQGKEILCKSVNVSELTTFVPPWNSWDRNTARALKETGFKILSADRYYYHKAAKGLTLIPFTAQLWELESILAKGNIPDDTVIVVLYHPPQIVEFDGMEQRFFGIDRFEKLLHRLTMTPTVKVVTLQQLAQDCSSLRIERYRKASTLWWLRSFWAGLLPPYLLPGEAGRPIYLETEKYGEKVKNWRIFTITLMAGLLLMGLIVRYIINRLVFSDRWRRRVDIAALALCCFAMISEICLVHRGYNPTGIRAIPIFFTASFPIALMLRTVKKHLTADLPA